MKVSAESWNGFVDSVFAGRVASVTRVEAEPWRHPWFCRLSWWDEARAFAVRVKPGFCLSGPSRARRDVSVSVPVVSSLAPERSLNRLNVSRPRSGGAVVEAFLREEPRLAIEPGRWRAIGTDADTSEGVPVFFRERGVNPSPVARVAGESVERRPRLLRSCDVVLSHDRLANATEWQQGAGVDGTVAQFFSNVASAPNRRERPYLRVMREFSPDEPVDPIEQMRGLWSDTGTDSIRVASLFLLSEPGVPAGSVPGFPPERWSPYVKHSVFWNLQYLESRFSAPAAQPPLVFPGLSLAGGVLGSFQPSLAQINDNFNALSQFLGTRLAAGVFVGM